MEIPLSRVYLLLILLIIQGTSNNRRIVLLDPYRSTSDDKIRRQINYFEGSILEILSRITIILEAQYLKVPFTSIGTTKGSSYSPNFTSKSSFIDK